MHAAEAKSDQPWLDTIRKLHTAILGGATPSEREAAHGRLLKKLTVKGLTFHEVPELLADSSGADGEWEAGFQAGSGGSDLRSAVIRKYGSAKAALEQDGRERCVEVAMEPVLRIRREDRMQDKRMVERWWELFETALGGAVPFPKTLEEAKAESTYWTLRSSERAICGERGTEAARLSIGCVGRRLLIDHAVLEARHGRKIRHKWDEEHSVPGFRRIMQALEHLRARGIDPDLTDIEAIRLRGADVQFEQKSTTTDRRAAVIELLNEHPELSDREIGRRVGCSQVTVGGQRRLLAARQEAERQRKAKAPRKRRSPAGTGQRASGVRAAGAQQ